MKDFLGITIKKGDRVVYARSTQSGGIEMTTHLVQDFTKDRVVVPVKQSFGRQVQYLKPENCVIYRTAKQEEAMVRNLEGIIEHLQMFKEVQNEQDFTDGT